MFVKALFDNLSETFADDNSIFIDDYAKALSAVADYLQMEITTNTLALIQVVKNDYLFLVDAHDKFQVLKVSLVGDKATVTTLSEFGILNSD